MDKDMRRRCSLKSSTNDWEVSLPEILTKKCGWKNDDTVKLDVIKMGMDVKILITKEDK